MKAQTIQLDHFQIANHLPFVVFAGPCVIESEDHTLKIAEALALDAEEAGVSLVFKSSFDKANRTSLQSYRGPGLDEGLRILQRVHDELGLATITDVHTAAQARAAADVVSILQTPAFLCRQSDFITDVAACAKPVNIKKGQFLAPEDMAYVLEKAKATGNDQIMLCERGSSFGYRQLIADMRSLIYMAETGAPVVFDATHSVQQPGGLGGATGGCRAHVPGLARAAVATGLAAVFMEVHPDPDHALSDGPNSLHSKDFLGLLQQLKKIDNVLKFS